MSRFRIAAGLVAVCLLLGATTLLAQGADRAELEGPRSSVSANDDVLGDAAPECILDMCLQGCYLEFNRCFNGCGSSGSFPLCVLQCENAENECQAICYTNCW
jgi:hypothetical protein